MSARKGKSSSHITYEDNNEDLIDEINSFHNKDRAIKKGSIHKRKTFDRPEEVLNVEAEASDSSDDDDGSDFDDDDVNDITDNKWGKKRKDFYGTGYVDKDWGGMREEEMEDAQLEEEDALTRQKQIDKSTAAIADLFEDDEEEEEKEEVVEVDTALEFNEQNARKKNRKVVKILEQFEARKRIFDLVVKPLEGVIKQIPKCALRSQLVYVAQTYASYLMNTAFLLNLKAKQFSKEKLEDPLIEIHPVTEALKRLEKKIVECEDFLHNHSDHLDALKKWAKSEPEKMEELVAKIGDVQLNKNTFGAGVNKIFSTPDDVSSGDVVSKHPSFTPMDAGEKRGANDRVAKNREYAERRGKKKAKISKTKNRRKVHAIEKRVKSQIGNVRREMDKYSGETTGIRASTIKSTRLVA